MEGLHVVLVVLSVVSFSHNFASGSVLEVTAKPGENISLYCDCKQSTGVFIVWYKNCTHKNQPSLVLHTKYNFEAGNKNADPHFHFVKNQSSNSYDLLIQNITESDEGFYHCGTEEQKVEEKEYIDSRMLRSYGTVVTKILVISDSDNSTSEEPVHVPWMMMFAPAITVISTFIFLILVFYLFEKTEPESLKKKTFCKVRMSQNQDEDICLTEVVFKPQDEETRQ